MESHPSPAFTHPYQGWLSRFNSLLLLALAVALLLNQTNFKLLSYLIEVITLILVISCCADPRNAGIRRQVFMAILVIAILLLCQLLSEEQQWPKSYVKNLVFMFCVMAAVALVPTPVTSPWGEYFSRTLLATLALTLLCYVLQVQLQGKDFGAFDNPHMLSLQIVVLFNLAIFYSLKYQGWGRLIAGAAIILSLLLLIPLPSRIAWFALLSSVLVWLFINFRQQRFIKLYALAALIASAYLSTQVNYAETPLAELADSDNLGITSIWHDERVIIWSDGLEMQRDSGLGSWLVGHGIGSFQEHFRTYSSFENPGTKFDRQEFVFPHNFFLEILHNNGIFGLLALLIPFAYIVVHTLRKSTQNNGDYHATLAIALLAGVFLHTFFTLPLFSNLPTTYLGLILGYCLRINRGESLHGQ